MNINRRGFLISLLAAPFIPKSGVNLPFNYIPHPAQVKFLMSDSPLSLYGIPYHQSGAAMGSWLGISREKQ